MRHQTTTVSHQQGKRLTFPRCFSTNNELYQPLAVTLGGHLIVEPHYCGYVESFGRFRFIIYSFSMIDSMVGCILLEMTHRFIINHIWSYFCSDIFSVFSTNKRYVPNITPPEQWKHSRPCKFCLTVWLFILLPSLSSVKYSFKAAYTDYSLYLVQIFHSRQYTNLASNFLLTFMSHDPHLATLSSDTHQKKKKKKVLNSSSRQICGHRAP